MKQRAGRFDVGEDRFGHSVMAHRGDALTIGFVKGGVSRIDRPHGPTLDASDDAMQSTTMADLRRFAGPRADGPGSWRDHKVDRAVSDVCRSGPEQELAQEQAKGAVPEWPEWLEWPESPELLAGVFELLECPRRGVWKDYHCQLRRSFDLEYYFRVRIFFVQLWTSQP